MVKENMGYISTPEELEKAEGTMTERQKELDIRRKQSIALFSTKEISNAADVNHARVVEGLGL